MRSVTEISTSLSANDRQTLADLIATPLWHSLVADSGGCFAIVNEEGRVVFANDVAGDVVQCPASQMIGRLMDELLPPAIAKERMGFLRQVMQTGRPLIVDAVFMGMYRSTVYRLHVGHAGAKYVLCAGRTGHMKPGVQLPPGMDYARTKHDDAGRFSSLTARELEILRMIGEGLTTAEIAKRLHRSVKTVEWHRVSLGTKLGVSNRVELARIAIDSGLVSSNSVPAASESTPED